MENFIQKLTALIQNHFPGSELELETANPHRVSGLLVWIGFENRSQMDRQRLVWAALRDGLPTDEWGQVSALLTMTPEEMSAARAG